MSDASHRPPDDAGRERSSALPLGRPAEAPPRGWPPSGWPAQQPPAVQRSPAPEGRGLLAQLAARSPRQVAALAALAAAALTTLSAFFLLLLAAEDFDLTFGDRVRIATSPVAAAVPLLLAAALVLHDRAGDPRGSADDDDGFGLGALLVGAVATVLLLARLVADLLAGDGALPSGGFGGFAGRLSTFLVDLAGVVLAAALSWWALRLRDRAPQAGDEGAPHAAGPPRQQGPPTAPPGQQWVPGPPTGPAQGPTPPG